MDYERMWNQLKQDIQMQEALSDNINIIKVINRITEIEKAEAQCEMNCKKEELSF